MTTISLDGDLQPGEIVVAEKIDRISRLPLVEAEKLVASIRDTGARLAIPGVVDLSGLAAGADGIAKIVLESVQDLLLRLALQMARRRLRRSPRAATARHRVGEERRPLHRMSARSGLGL
ncbi:hypothetical protein [Verminephrobacter aporrectodeae]